jgi:hypothetical protein
MEQIWKDIENGRLKPYEHKDVAICLSGAIPAALRQEIARNCIHQSKVRITIPPMEVIGIRCVCGPRPFRLIAPLDETFRLTSTCCPAWSCGLPSVCIRRLDETKDVSDRQRLAVNRGCHASCHSASVIRLSNGRPARNRSTFCAKSSPMRAGKSRLRSEPETCGVRMTFGNLQSGWSAGSG